MDYKKICFLDTETTDKYWNSSAPVQIAAIITDEKGNMIDSYNQRIKTTHKISPDASAVHGIYARDLLHCRSEIDILNEFCAWMTANEVDLIITYNGEVFDRPMLNERCRVLGIDTPFFDKTRFHGIDGYYDCVKKAKDKNMYGLKDKLGRKWKLSLVAEVLGFSNAGAHDALADVVMLKNIYFMLMPQLQNNSLI